MRTVLQIAATGRDSLRQHSARSVVTIACLVAIVTPYLATSGIAAALRQQAMLAVDTGPDLYVSATRFGRPAALPVAWADQVRKIDGVVRVVPRIVGAATLGKERVPLVVVGMHPPHLPEHVSCVRGRLFGQQPYEAVLGTELARRLRLEVGSKIPPFYRSASGEHVFTVVGLFEADVSLWQANVLFVSLHSAAEIFDQADLVTDLLIECRRGYERSVAAAAQRLSVNEASSGSRQVRVVSRAQLAAGVSAAQRHREGIVQLHLLTAAALGIPVVLVTSGIGLRERRRETGILKALGWRTDQVLLRNLVEGVLLAIVAASLAVVLAFAWLRGLNGLGVAAVFFDGTGPRPDFRVPFQLTPAPALLGTLLSLVIVLTGSLYTTWRVAAAAPCEAMR